MSFLGIASNLLIAAILTLAPTWARPGTYFGVRVAPENRHGPLAAHVRRRFTAAIWAVTAVTAAWSAWAPNLMFAGHLIQLAAAVLAFRSGWREMKPYSVTPPSIRTVHLFAEPPRVPGGLAAAIAPFLVLAGTSAALLKNWSAIPLRFPIHWNTAGEANGWSDRTPIGVFAPVLIGITILALISAWMVFVRRSARRVPAGSAQWRTNRAILGILLMVMFCISISFSLAALTPLILDHGRFPVPAFVMVLIPIATVLGSIVWLVRANAQAGDLPADTTPDDCWKWGQVYYNPEDPSRVVEKRFGWGYTLNFARWESWVMLVLTLLVPVAVILLTQL